MAICRSSAPVLHDREQADLREAGRCAREPHRRVEGERRDEHHVAHDRRCNMAAMKVVFLAPSYPPEMQQYTRGLAEVGKGRKPPEWVGEVLAARDRHRAPRTAPAGGLTLMEVIY